MNFSLVPFYDAIFDRIKIPSSHSFTLKKKLIRITTIPMALKYLLPGQMNFMQNNGFDVIMISADGEERNDIIRNENCPHIIVPLTRKITPLQDLKCLLQLIKIFRKEKPDIVHSHTPKAGLLGMLAARICRIKIRIHTVAGLPLMVEKGNRFLLLKFIEKLTYASATHIWPNSASIKNYIISHKLVSEKKVSVILNGSTNGINLERFSKNVLKENLFKEIKQAINYSAETIYLLFIGRLVFDKGIVELVTAFNGLQNEGQKIKLVLAGDFEERLDPLPEVIVESIKTSKAIIHIPWTQHVEYFMALSDLFVFPSHREGFPNVLLQSGAMGLPILCSRIPGNVDIVSQDETGLLFEVNDSNGIREALQFAIQNMDMMGQMADTLKKKTQQNFRREDVWNAILQRYLGFLNPKKTIK